jgi:tetratricopeptide (TPR) repeat protein
MSDTRETLTTDPQLEAALQRVTELQSANQLEEAREMLAAILAETPEQPDALHLMSLLRFRDGERDPGAEAEAVAMLRRAVAQAPHFMTMRSNLALMLRMMGRGQEAAELLRAALATDPDNPEALLNQGYELLRLRDGAGAAEMFLKTVHLQPDNPLAHAGLGTARLLQQRFQEAEASLRQALGLSPANHEVHMHLGLVLRALGRLDEGIGSLRVALLLRPSYEEAQTNLGLLLLQRGRTDEALAALRAAVALNPKRGEAHFAIAQILYPQGDVDGAIASLRQAAATLPNPALALDALRQVLGAAGRSAELLALEQQRGANTPADRLRLARAMAQGGALDDAVALLEGIGPEAAESVAALSTLGGIRYIQGRTDDARAAYAAVLARAPGDASARTTLAMMALAEGDFAAGLPGFEARFELPQLAAFRPAGTMLPPLASGVALSGRRVLLAAEQGQGDTLHFVRYARLLANRGAEVLLEVQAPLVGLLAGMPGVAGVTAQGSVAPAADFVCPMMSLPLVFGTDVDSIPAVVPYLTVPADRRAAWRARLAESATAGRRRVALCWSGNPGYSADRFRSIPLGDFAPLLADAGLAVHLVQTDIRDGDDALVAAHPGVVDLRRDLGDFADTAAVLAEMDLVISVDTAVAHLAGALARPVWLLLPYAADWRWLQDRNDSPWYPTARLFRQEAAGDWAPVLASVRAALRPH